MPLWLLSARADLPCTDSPWRGHGETTRGLLVRAPSADAARALACTVHGDEAFLEVPRHVPGLPALVRVERTLDVWLDPRYTTCALLTDDGPDGILLVEYSN